MSPSGNEEAAELRRQLVTLEDEVVTRLAMPTSTRAATAGCRPEVMAVLEVAQRRLARVDPEPDRAATAPVTPVRPTTGHVGLAPEAHRAGPAVAALDVEAALVDELGHALRLRAPTMAPRTRLALHGHRRHVG